MALADERAGHVLARADDVADAAIDIAGQTANLDAILGRDRHGCGGEYDCGQCRGDQLLHMHSLNVCLSPCARRQTTLFDAG